MSYLNVRLLSNDDLEGLASKLTVKRARRELDSGTLSVVFSEHEEVLVAQWSDGIRCEFPSLGGLGASRCSCPARTLCIHRVRTIFAYRDRPLAAQSEDAEWSPAMYGDEVLERSGNVDAALRMLHDGFEVERESRTAVTLPELGIRVRFMPGRPLQDAVCSCRASQGCLHRVIGALSFRDPLPPVPDDGLEASRRAHLWRITLMLASVGLDGLPREASEALEATHLEIVGEGLHGPAKDLQQLGRLLRAYHQRAYFDGRRWLVVLSRLAHRLDAWPRVRGPQLRHLRGAGRYTRLEAKKLALVGLGAEGFSGSDGTIVKAYFALGTTGRILTATVGRGGASNLSALFRDVPMLGEASAQMLVDSAFVVHCARTSPTGTIGSGRETRVVQRTPAPPLEHVAPQLVVRSPAELSARWRAHVPPLLREKNSAEMLTIFALDPRFVPSPSFDERTQQLELVLGLAGGGGVRVAVPHGMNAGLTHALERWALWETPATHLLANVSFGERGFVVRPMTASTSGQMLQLWLGETPPTMLALPMPSPVPDLGLAPPSAVDDAVEALLQTLEGWVSGGLDRPADWRRAHVRQVARELEAHGLAQVAARAYGYLDAADVDARLRALATLIFHLTSLAEALLVARISA